MVVTELGNLIPFGFSQHHVLLISGLVVAFKQRGKKQGRLTLAHQQTTRDSNPPCLTEARHCRSREKGTKPKASRMQRPGRPSDTLARRLIRRQQHAARRQYRQETAQYSRNATEQSAAKGPRRSLRIQWQRDNGEWIAAGLGPWYTLRLFGEADLYHCDLPPKEYQTVVGQ